MLSKHLKTLRPVSMRTMSIGMIIRISLLLVIMAAIVGSAPRARTWLTKPMVEPGASTSKSIQPDSLEAPRDSDLKTLTPLAFTALDAPQSEQNEGKVILLTIRPTGFEPKEITIPAGQYLIVIRSRTSLAEFSIRLERSTGARLHDVRVPRYKRDWKQYLLLTPDTYLISEGDHPDWVCRITVTAR